MDLRGGKSSRVTTNSGTTAGPSHHSEGYTDNGCWSPDTTSNTSTSSSSITPTASAASSPPPSGSLANNTSIYQANDDNSAHSSSNRRLLCTLAVKLPEGTISEVEYPLASKTE